MDKERSGPSAWTIAAGVFLGLTMLKACSVFTETAMQQAAIDQYNAQIAELRKDQAQARMTEQARLERNREVFQSHVEERIRERDAMKARGDRCIDHRLLRRIPNGWEQGGDC